MAARQIQANRTADRWRIRPVSDWLANHASPLVDVARLIAGSMVYFGVILVIVSGVGYGISMIPGFAGAVALFTIGLALIAAAPTVAGWVTTKVLSVTPILRGD